MTDDKSGNKMPDDKMLDDKTPGTKVKVNRVTVNKVVNVTDNEVANQTPGDGDRGGLELLFQTFARPVVFVLVFLGFHLFWRGHNAPGGGFIAGLVVAVAALLSRIVLDRPFLNITPQKLLPWGLLLALVPGVVPMLFGGAFLKSAYGYLTGPLIGEFEWATAVVFDAGVFLVVVGTTLTIIELLAEDTDATLVVIGEDE